VQRRLFNLLATASLLMCMATIGLWTRSLYLQETFYFGRYSLGTAGGQLWIQFASRPASRAGYDCLPQSPNSSTFFGFSYAPQYAGGWIDESLGFALASRPFPPDHFTNIAVPFWFPSILTAVPPVLWLKRRRGKHPTGRCQTCGYDMRATPNRCPECGTTISPAHS